MSLDVPTLIAVAICWLVPAVLYSMLPPTYELHQYQIAFLKSLAAKDPAVDACAEEHHVSGPAAALQMIVIKALQDEKDKAEMYDGFQCVHCGSKNPAAWIKENKGKKEPYSLAVTAEVAKFLASDLLVPVQKVGTPPARQVVPGPRRSDPSKAARVAIDWAIQKFGALEDGQPKAASKKAASRVSRSPKRR